MSDTSKRNETHSWSGYNYQGKVGIFVALDYLYKYLLEKKNIKDLYIEYEGNSGEDFQIKKKGKEVPVSVHQVKASLTIKNLNDIKDILTVDLSQRKEETYEKNDDKKKKGFNKQGCDECYLHLIQEIQGFGLTKEEYKTQIQKGKLKPVYVQNTNNIKLYPNPDEANICELLNIDLLILKKIVEIDNYTKDEAEPEIDENIAEIIFESLVLDLDKKIDSEREKENPRPQINLTEILERIKEIDPKSKDRKRSNRIFKWKNDLMFYIEEYSGLKI